MVPSEATRLSRLAACRSDLLDNGIDMDRLGLRDLSRLVRRNLRYFQFMLGYDAGLRDVVALVERARGPH